MGWYVSVHGFSAYRYVRVLYPFARGMRGPPVFCPKGSRPVVQLAHGVSTQDYPIDRGKKKHRKASKNVKKTSKNDVRKTPLSKLCFSKFFDVFFFAAKRHQICPQERKRTPNGAPDFAERDYRKNPHPVTRAGENGG